MRPPHLRPLLPALVVALGLVLAPSAAADHIPGQPCRNCASHAFWPSIDGVIARAPKTRGGRLKGGARHDQLMGWHGSDVLRGRRASDVLWGDHDPVGNNGWQVDRIFGGRGNDFIYGSHGRNVIYAGPGNDAISVHYGRGLVDCGAGRDIYHVARSRRRGYRFRNCERVDFRSERQRGRGLKPLP